MLQVRNQINPLQNITLISRNVTTTNVTRTKRWKGVMYPIMWILFENMEHDSPSVGRLKFDLEKIQTTQGLSLKEFDRINSQMKSIKDTHANLTKTDNDVIKVEMDLTRVHTAVIGSLILTEARYNTLHNSLPLIQEEISKAGKIILDRIAPYKIPELNQIHLSHISPQSLTKTESGEIYYVIAVPLVYPELFTQYFVFPLPYNGVIHNLKSTKAFVNRELELLRKQLQKFIKLPKIVPADISSYIIG